MAQEYFELANVLDGSMTPEEAREYYIKSIGELYGVCTCMWYVYIRGMYVYGVCISMGYIHVWGMYIYWVCT